MHSAVEKILAGEFNQNMHSLDFSVPRIEFSVHPGEKHEGSFLIIGPDNLLTEGNVFTNRLRMKCLTERFSGVQEEIGYCFDAVNMEEGETVKGEFCIVSNRGEYMIPFEVTVRAESLTSSLGDIRNLFHFTNLARTNWDEAVKLFYTKEFTQIFKGTDKQYYAVYKGLSQGVKSEQNVEEFLLEINKKQEIDFILEEEEIRIPDPRDDAEYKVVLNRNGWGFSKLQVDVTGDFIILEKTMLCDDDFLGNYARLPFYIAKEKLHGGKNYAEIHIHNAYFSKTVKVIVHSQGIKTRVPGVRIRKKHLVMELMQYYEGFRTKKINAQLWMKETAGILERLSETDERDIHTKLFQAQLLITQERFNEAKWLLDQIKDYVDADEPAVYCYYLYLITLIITDEEFVEETAAQVERIFVQNSDNWRIAWLLLYLSDEYTKSPSRKWVFLEEQFKKGCSSPVLYLEAYNLIVQNPTLLMRLESFEKQVLTYAAKKEIITPVIAQQVVYLAAREKEYSDSVFFLLEKCYDVVPEDETLQVICTLLIKGNLAGEKQFKWYALGIESKLRITRLYEYYMMSCAMSDDMEIPKIVLMYFAFDSSLDSLHNSYLYAYINTHKNDFSELYDSYRSQIERFVITQAMQGKNNKWLASLYRSVLTPALMTPEIASGLSKALFVHQIKIKRSDIQKVILVYEKRQSEIVIPIYGKEIYTPIYSSDVRVLLEDGMGNRYCRESDYQMDKLMIPDKILHMAEPYLTGNLDIAFWLCENGRSIAPVSHENVSQMKLVVDADILSDSLQKEMRLRLLHYFYDNDYIEELDIFLNRLVYHQISSADFAQVVRFLVVRGMHEKAYEWIRLSGGEGIDAKLTMRLCSQIIAVEEGCADEVLSNLTFRAFSAGKYDENVLNYLVKYYSGTLKEMRDVWKAARAFGVDTYEICNRMLVQMLYTGAYIGEKIEVFKDFIAGGGRCDVELAFLAQSCFDYFVGEKITDDYIMQELQRVIEREEEIPLVCKLAYTKYYSENKQSINEKISVHLVVFLRELLSEKMYFPYFKEYCDSIGFMRCFADKTMIQYKLEEGDSAVIHYLMEEEGSSRGEYVQEEMEDMFYGICVKQFVLFFGERLQYYITENSTGAEILTGSGTLGRSDTDREQKESKYSLINDIAIGRALRDDNTVERLLHEYYEKEFIVKELFHIL